MSLRESLTSAVATLLQEVEVVVLTNQDCRKNYGYSSSSITNKMLCANVDGGGSDSCQVTVGYCILRIMKVLGLYLS